MSEIDPLEQAGAWLARGEPVALATVIETWGSSPRRPGSKMAINGAGDFVGSVSGGCVEAAVIETAARVIETGEAALLEFGVSHEQAWEVGLACGGRVEIVVDRARAEPLDALIAARREKRPVALITELPGGAQDVIGDAAEIDRADLAAAVAGALASDRAAVVEVGGARYLIEPFNPPLRLIVVGAVHIAQPLVQMAALAGFAVVLVDPRSGFATAARFDGVERVDGWPDEALERLGLDARTAVVALTHDPKIDDPALEAALASPAFYVGALGSRKTQAARRRRLAAAGIDAASIDRIHGPVGLDIGALTPAEIAVAIVAEIIEVLRR